MFVVHCDGCAARTLIFPSQVDGIVDDGMGTMLVAYHCSAGHRGVLRTGRGAEEAADADVTVATASREVATVGC